MPKIPKSRHRRTAATQSDSEPRSWLSQKGVEKTQTGPENGGGTPVIVISPPARKRTGNRMKIQQQTIIKERREKEKTVLASG